MLYIEYGCQLFMPFLTRKYGNALIVRNSITTYLLKGIVILHIKVS